MDKKLEKLADQYEGNLLNYFYGMTPEQSKKFNKMIKQNKLKRRKTKWNLMSTSTLLLASMT